MSSKAIAVWIVAVWVVPLGAGCASSGRTILCDAQGPRFTIVTHGDASAEEVAAAKELREYLHRISGHQFSIESSRAEQPEILVARADRTEDVDAGDLGPDGLMIEVRSDSIRLIGGDDRGVGYAVTTFLEDLGVRWIMPGAFG